MDTIFNTKTTSEVNPKECQKKEYSPPTITITIIEMENCLAAGSATVQTSNSTPTVENETYGDVTGGTTSDW
jgi:hypothetical protein